MKPKVTKKEMKEKWGSKLLYVPDGTMQHFARVTSPVAYSERAEGWACDYYEFTDFCLNEGYAPVGKQIMTYGECRPFCDASREIIRRYLPYEEEQKLLNNLLTDFLGTINEKLAKKGKK